MDVGTILNDGINGAQIDNTPLHSTSYGIPYEILHFREDDMIFQEGEQARGLYYVQSGCVKVIVNRLQNRGRTTSPEYVTKLVSPGEFFGYKALVRNGLITSHARALKASTVWLYSKESIMSALGNSSPLIKMLMNQAVNDIESFETTSQLHYLASVEERIAHQIVAMGDKFGVGGEQGIVINLKLTRNEFAQLASTINESLSRHLTEFKNEGLIDLNGKEIIIKDREALLQKSGNRMN